MRHLRAGGMTYQAIADAAGVSADTAHRLTRDVQLSDFGKLPGADGKARPPAYAPRQETEDVELFDFEKLPGKDGEQESEEMAALGWWFQPGAVRTASALSWGRGRQRHPAKDTSAMRRFGRLGGGGRE